MNAIGLAILSLGFACGFMAAICFFRMRLHAMRNAAKHRGNTERQWAAILVEDEIFG